MTISCKNIYHLKIYACTFMLFPSGSRAEPADYLVTPLTSTSNPNQAPSPPLSHPIYTINTWGQSHMPYFDLRLINLVVQSKAAFGIANQFCPFYHPSSPSPLLPLYTFALHFLA